MLPTLRPEQTLRVHHSIVRLYTASSCFSAQHSRQPRPVGQNLPSRNVGPRCAKNGAQKPQLQAFSKLT